MPSGAAGPGPVVPGRPEPTWPRLLTELIAGRDLSRDEAGWAMDRVMAGEATAVQLSGFLVALRAKGETVEELTGLADAMLGHAIRIEVPGPCVDVVGTGGDRHHTVNISTMAALVVAGTGRRVVKHGNRAASSSTGAADVLERLGVRLDQSPQRVAELALEVGITFCFAQMFHPAMRHAGQARGGLGIPTAFNFLGPLTNPAQPEASAIGVYDARMATLMAGVLAGKGRSALVFRGEDGLDELSTTGPSRVWVVSGGTVREELFDPAALDLPVATLADLRGGDADHNAAVVRDLLAGKPGPVRDAVLLNAAAALAAAEGATDVPPTDVPSTGGVSTDVPSTGVPSTGGVSGAGSGVLLERLRVGLAEAAAAVDSGAASAVLERWVSASAG